MKGLGRFWQELKRRNVVRVIAMYGGIVYIIIELVSNISEPLHLPQWFATLVILLLAIGFPIIAILSWIFDFTPEGIVKTESIAEIENQESQLAPAKRKLKISDVIIVLLFAGVCVLLYPKIIHKDRFKDLRDIDGRISIAVMPFQNLTNDTSWDIWQTGIQNELITILSNSSELSIRTYQSISEIIRGYDEEYQTSIIPSAASTISSRMNANCFILGSIKKSRDIIRLNAQLMNTETEEIYKSYQIDGRSEEDVFSLTDSLARLIKNYLEIETLEKDAYYHVQLHSTHSSKALRYYIEALDLFFDDEYPEAIELFSKAVEIDSLFFGALNLLICSYYNNEEIENAKLILNRTADHIEHASMYDRLWFKCHKARLKKNPQEVIEATRRLTEKFPDERHTWFDLGISYMQVHQYENAVHAFQEAFNVSDRYGSDWKWRWIYTSAGYCYHVLGDHDQEKKIYELGLRVFPGEEEIIFRQAVCALSLEDINKAHHSIETYRSILENKDLNEFLVDYQVGTIYWEAGNSELALDMLMNLVAEDHLQERRKLILLGRILIIDEIDIAGGIDFINQALEIESECPTCLYLKGLGYYKQGRTDEAYELVTEAWDLRPFYHHEHYLLIQEVE
jgi:tetratricopeptide (TPR) repeat protein